MTERKHDLQLEGVHKFSSKQDGGWRLSEPLLMMFGGLAIQRFEREHFLTLKKISPIIKIPGRAEDRRTDLNGYFTMSKISMIRSISTLFVLSILSAGVWAADPNTCKTANAQAEANGGMYAPPMEARVNQGGRAQFYSAPDESCEMKGLFLVPNDYVLGYTKYKAWIQVMYLNTKTGRETQGWIKDDRLKLVSQLGGKRD